MIRRKLNGPNCDMKAAQSYAATFAATSFNPALALFLARAESQRVFNVCRCQNNAEYYFDNNSWAQYGGNSAEVYSWAYEACKTNPLRDLGSSSSENSYLFYQKYLEAKTGTGPGGFNPITSAPGGGTSPGSGGTGTQQTRPNLLIPALIGAAILFLPFP